MFLKTAFPFLAAILLLSFGGPSWADGERGTKAEATAYASREGEAPVLQEFSGGLLGGLLAAIVAFVSNAVQSIIELFSGDDFEVPPPGEQGRAPLAELPASA